MQTAPDLSKITKNFEKAFDFKRRIGLYDTVQVNEDFFVGKQWEGVQSGGLPTPTFNFLKQVVNFQVATITSSSMTVQASPMAAVSPYPAGEVEQMAKLLSDQFAAILERNRFPAQMRQLMRNAAVDGDGCIYCWFDPAVENGQPVKGEIVTELIENTRVHFGNPNCRDVQAQPYIILSRRELVEDVQFRAEKYRQAGVFGMDSIASVTADSEKFQNSYDSFTDDKVTVLTYLYRDRDSGHIFCCEATEKGILRNAYDTGYTRYPLVWISWDNIPDCYHGQAMITGLIPNQKFINKMFAMVGISLMTTAFPKVIYDQSRIRSWDGSVGTAVGVNGPVEDVARTVDGASVNPQIAQFIQLAIDKSRAFLGASDVAMGDGRPDNTSAIIALQRAANTPMEMTKQSLYSCVEELARVFMDMMTARYGLRTVELAGQQLLFDFSQLGKYPISIRLDVGASSYWSEMASMQTLDNLLSSGQITLRQYLERLPAGYLTGKETLLRQLEEQGEQPGKKITGWKKKEDIDSLPVTASHGRLQQALNRQGVQ